MPRGQASTRGRKQTATRMEHGAQTVANPANDLLRRQFASITDVLVKASQRRNAELQELQQRRLRPVHTQSTSESAPEPPANAEPGPSQGSNSCDDRLELEQVYKSDEGTLSDKSTVVASATGRPNMQETQVHLRGGYVSDYADNPKTMLAELNSSQQQHSGSGTKEELDNDYDLVRMRADVNKISSSSKDIVVVRVNTPKAMLADSGMDAEDELSALAKRLGVDSDEDTALKDARAMLADFDEAKQASDTDHSEDEDYDLETLRGKMDAMFSLSPDIASKVSPDTAKNTAVVGKTLHSRQHAVEMPKPDDIQYPDMTEAEAKKEMEEMVRRENEKLDATIKYVLAEEERYRAIEEKKSLPKRLIVTNLAAGVDEEAIRILFVKYKWDIQNIAILPEREPVKRTKTAYIDMYSREKAVHASYEVGAIYGLIVKIKLAVE